MTIYEIKRRTAETSPYFFTPKTMRFFGQTLRSFKVKKIDNTHYSISAPMIDKSTGRTVGQSQRVFNTETNELNQVTK